mgnify:CR=1 FL=1|jgi:hypothetical protein
MSLRVRVFRPDEAGKYFFYVTLMVPEDSSIVNLHKRIEVEEGDVVLAFDWYLKWVRSPHTGDLKWMSLRPDSPAVQGLYTQAVAAERTGVC